MWKGGDILIKNAQRSIHDYDDISELIFFDSIIGSISLKLLQRTDESSRVTVEFYKKGLN